jgi:hypothetical protein
MLPGNGDHLLPTAAVTTVVVSRVSMVRRGGSSRALWLAMAFLAASLSTASPAIYHGLNFLLGGTPVGGAVFKLWFALGAAASVRMLCTTLAGRSETTVLRDWLLAGLVAIVVAVPTVVSPPTHLSPLALHTSGFYDTTWRSWVNWVPFLLYLSWALGSGVVVCWRYGRQAAVSPVRTGLTLIGVGCASGFGVVGMKVAVLIAWHTGAESRSLMSFNSKSENGILIVCCGLIAVGSSWEAISGWMSSRRDSWWARQSYRELESLWRALIGLYPAVVLDAGAHGVGRPRFRLLRRVVEIRDGILALADDVDPRIVDRARRSAAAEGGDTDDVDAVVVAVAVRWATMSPHPTDEHGELPVGGSGNLTEEVQWLKKVSRAYHRREWSGLATKLAGESRQAAA